GSAALQNESDDLLWAARPHLSCHGGPVVDRGAVGPVDPDCLVTAASDRPGGCRPETAGRGCAVRSVGQGPDRSGPCAQDPPYPALCPRRGPPPSDPAPAQPGRIPP